MIDALALFYEFCSGMDKNIKEVLKKKLANKDLYNIEKYQE